MRSGAMRQRLQLQTPSTTQDGMGGLIPSFVPGATIWGQVDPLTGREQLMAAQVTATMTHQITIRYRTGIVPKMRLVRQGAGSQTYEINAVVNLELRNRTLELLCTEIQTTGA